VILLVSGDDSQRQGSRKETGGVCGKRARCNTDGMPIEILLHLFVTNARIPGPVLSGRLLTPETAQ
jgi:hypothetical protein